LEQIKVAIASWIDDMIRFREPSGPLLWIKNSKHLELSKEGEILHIKDTNFSLGVFLFSLPFLLVGLGIIGMAFFFSGSMLYDLTANDSVCDTSYSTEVELGNSMYCEDQYSSYSVGLESVEIADQHFKYIGVNDYGDHVQEFRWSEYNGILALGLLSDDGDGGQIYDCHLYKKASSLDANWSIDDLIVHNYWDAMPNWCYNDATSTDDLNYSQAASPLFDGERLYELTDDNYGELYFKTYSNIDVENRMLMLPYAPMMWYIPLITLLFGLVFGGMFASAGDPRKLHVRLDTAARTVHTGKAWAITRLGGWTWNEVDFSSIVLKQYKKSVDHVSGGGEDGPTQHWTTSHKGIEVSLVCEGKPISILFLEHGEQFSMYDSALKNFCNSLGVEMPEMLKFIKPSVLSTKTYTGIELKDFSVSVWDSNNDAKHLVGWYNDTSKSNNLELREALKGAGIKRLRSNQDAQKLLDSLVKLLEEELGVNAVEEPLEEYSERAEENMSEEDGEEQNAPSGSFWNDL